MVLKAKHDCSGTVQSNTMAVNLINTMSPIFQPFIILGTVSIIGPDPTVIKILQDTGAAQSLLLADMLPLSDKTFCKSYVMAQGKEMGMVKIPLHQVYSSSKLITGMV